MKRVWTVIVAAVFTTMISGITDVSWADQGLQAEVDAHRQKIAEAFRSIPVGSPIEIDPVRGADFQAILESVTDDAITVRLVSGNYAVSRMIPFDEIRNVKRIRAINSHRGRNIAILVGVGAAVVLVGTCANSLSADLSPATRSDRAK